MVPNRFSEGERGLAASKEKWLVQDHRTAKGGLPLLGPSCLTPSLRQEHLKKVTGGLEGEKPRWDLLSTQPSTQSSRLPGILAGLSSSELLLSMSMVRAQLEGLGVQKVRSIPVWFMRHCSLPFRRRGGPRVPQAALLSPDHRGLSVWLVLLWGCQKEGNETAI